MDKPSISLKIVNEKGVVVQHVRSSKSRRIFVYIQRNDFVDYEFAVSVTYASGAKNETRFQNKKETLKALRAFLEK